MIKFNIIIPSIKVDELLIKCVQGIIGQKFKNYSLSIIIEQKDNTDYLKKILNQKKITYKIIISKLTNISAKRNLGSKQFNSEYLAFIDSDAYPINSWLDIGLKYFETEKIIILGGPSGLPFKDEEEKYLLSNYAKRSFFCTANLSKRKYSKKNHYFDWLESCNFIITKSAFDKVGGMDENQYIFEDLELCSKINKRYGKGKILFAGDFIVYHKDRNIINFLKQRFVYGMFINEALKKSNFFGKILSLIPIFSSIIFLVFFIYFYNYIKFYYILFFLFSLCFFIFYLDLKKFKLKFIFLFKVFLLTIFANLAYVSGNLFSFINKLKLSKKIYSNSQS